MNICTYVTAVSMEPKFMLVAVYDNTQTAANLSVSPRALLQLLPESLAPVVRICGQQSGKDINKIARLKKRFALKEHQGLPYFADAAGFLELVFEQKYSVGGDHVLAVARVVTHKNLHDVPLLTTDYLKQHGYIR